MVKTEECKIEKYFAENKIKKSLTLLIFWNKYNNHVFTWPSEKSSFCIKYKNRNERWEYLTWRTIFNVVLSFILWGIRDYILCHTQLYIPCLRTVVSWSEFKKWGFQTLNSLKVDKKSFPLQDLLKRVTASN